jgi:hypothetical protein
MAETQDTRQDAGVEKPSHQVIDTAASSSVGTKLFDSLKVLLPDKLQKLMEAWGPGFAVGFICAIVTTAGLYYSGSMPAFLVSSDYKKPAPDVTEQHPEVPLPMTNVGFKRLERPVEAWMEPYLKEYEEEADQRKQGDTALHAAIGAVSSAELSTVQRFTWTLHPSPGYSLSVWAFRKTKDNLIQPLQVDRNNNALSVAVPSCNKGDRLIAVVYAEWKFDVPEANILATYVSTFS